MRDVERPLAETEFDRLFAESAGPHLRVYVSARLPDVTATALDAALEDVIATLLAHGAFVHSGDRQSFQTRLYAIVDRVLPHLGKPAIRKPLPPELTARAHRFVLLIAEHWHGAFEDALATLRRLEPREREAALLRDFHELTMQEIGQRLGMRTDAARAFVHATHARMRELPKLLR